jgi:SET domain-containing protein
MKKKNSYLSYKCCAKRKSKIHGFGVFAQQNIKKGELIVVWGGCIFTAEEVNKLPKRLITYPVKVYNNLYLGQKIQSNIDDAEMFNHSCNPNAYIFGQNILLAKRNIKKGEEICFDYATTEDDPSWEFDCLCGAKNCRHIIKGNDWHDPVFQKRNLSYFSFYLQEKIKKQKIKKL